MPDEGGEYKSIEEVRSILYPRSAAILDLEKDDVLEFPANLTDELAVGDGAALLVPRAHSSLSLS